MEAVNLCQICKNDHVLKPLSDLNQDVITFVLSNVIYLDSYLICSNCFKIIRHIFAFKKSCLETESNIIKYSMTNVDKEIKMKDILGIKVKTPVRICRMCSKTFENSSPMIPIAEHNIKQIINKCLPELNLYVVKNPLSCDICLQMVKQYLSVLQCLAIEQIKEETEYDVEDEVDIKEHGICKLDDLEDHMDGSVSPANDDEALYLESSAIKQPITKLSVKEVFECVICYKQFSLSQLLTEHMAVHTVKAFNCEVCNRQFSNMSSLKSHAKSHVEKKTRLKCEVCGKLLRDAYTLKRHMRSHTGEELKQFKCEYCNKHWRDAYVLKRHLRTHTGDRPFKCELCGKNFTQKSKLTEHLRSHTGQKLLLYKCGLCEKKFRDMYAMRRHFKVHKKKIKSK